MPLLPRSSITDSQYLNDIPLDRTTRDKQDPGSGTMLGSDYRKKYAGDEKVIGIGGERIVIEDGDEAVAITYYGDKYSALTTFYTQRILHTLYPRNFPRFKAVYFSKQHGVNVEYRTRVDFEQEYPANDPNITYFDDIAKKLCDMGVSISGGIASFGGEYLCISGNENLGLVTSEKGEQYEVFLDAVRPSSVDLGGWDFQMLHSTMLEAGYSKTAVRSVMRSALRISTQAQEKLLRLESGVENDWHPSHIYPNILNDSQYEYILSVLAKQG